MTDAQRDQIILAYQTGGYPAAKAYVMEQGISITYIARLLRKRGIPNTSRKGPYRQRGHGMTNDARWARAIAIGPVLA